MRARRGVGPARPSSYACCWAKTGALLETAGERVRTQAFAGCFEQSAQFRQEFLQAVSDRIA